MSDSTTEAIMSEMLRLTRAGKMEWLSRSGDTSRLELSNVTGDVETRVLGKESGVDIAACDGGGRMIMSAWYSEPGTAGELADAAEESARSRIRLQLEALREAGGDPEGHAPLVEAMGRIAMRLRELTQSGGIQWSFMPRANGAAVRSAQSGRAVFRIHEEPSSGPEKKRGVLQAKMDGRVCGAAETSDPLQGEAVRALLRAVGGEKEHEPEQPGNAAEQETVERLREKFLESLRVSG